MFSLLLIAPHVYIFHLRWEKTSSSIIHFNFKLKYLNNDDKEIVLNKAWLLILILWLSCEDGLKIWVRIMKIQW